MGTDYLDDNKFRINDNNLELTTTWTTITTKTTQPLATVSPLNVVYVVYVVVKGNRRTSDKDYPDDRITMQQSRLPRDPGCSL